MLKICCFHPFVTITLVHREKKKPLYCTSASALDIRTRCPDDINRRKIIGTCAATKFTIHGFMIDAGN